MPTNIDGSLPDAAIYQELFRSRVTGTPLRPLVQNNFDAAFEGSRLCPKLTEKQGVRRESRFHRVRAMTSVESPLVADVPNRASRSMRRYRASLWGLAAGLKACGVVTAFIIAANSGRLGVAALAIALAGLLLRSILVATSYGD
jgi:hypothetical protein